MLSNVKLHIKKFKNAGPASRLSHLLGQNYSESRVHDSEDLRILSRQHSTWDRHSFTHLLVQTVR